MRYQHVSRRLRRLLPILAAAAAFAVPATANATIWPAHCAWSTDRTFHYSPAYNIWYIYLGHQVISGKYYRQYGEYLSPGYGFQGVALVYCG